MSCFECVKCNYVTDKKGNYNRHLKTKKHLELFNYVNCNITDNQTTNLELFICLNCNYVTDKISNYNRHIKTTKHLELFSCINCTFTTKKKFNLIRHEKNGNCGKNPIPDKSPQVDLYNLELNLQKILKEQKIIKKMIPNTGNTIINNKLSINVFLNTECKEAMSIQDFLNQLKLSLEDLYYTKKNGFVKGISNVFVKELAHLDPKERPIHCIDKKRLHIYVKNTNSWEKDDDNKNINKAINNVQRKQIEVLYNWELNHPGWEKNEKMINERLGLANSVYGSIKDNDRMKDKKAIKKKICENINLDIAIFDKD